MKFGVFEFNFVTDDYSTIEGKERLVANIIRLRGLVSLADAYIWLPISFILSLSFLLLGILLVGITKVELKPNLHLSFW